MSEIIDRINRYTGQAVAWLTLVMVALTFVIVVMRYAFDSGSIALQEAVTWMHAAAFMLGMAYALQTDQHVRVDIFYRDMSPRKKAVVDLLGVLLMLLPLCAYFCIEAWPYIQKSWVAKESSRQAQGLPYPWVPILKSMILIMPVMVALQGISMALKSVATLRNGGRT